MGSGSGAISSEGVNDFHFFGSPHKLLIPGAGTFVLLALEAPRLVVPSSVRVLKHEATITTGPSVLPACQSGLINQEGVYVGEWTNGSHIYTLRDVGRQLAPR
jgi:hypothetical protein